jgi:hypothetical protein
MKKSHHFTELSNKVCDVEGCGRKIKERLTDGADWTGKKEPRNITKCFHCYSALRKAEMTHNQAVGFRTTLKHIKALRFQFKMDKLQKDEKKAARLEAKAQANNA